jgi:hypothetical protein
MTSRRWFTVAGILGTELVLSWLFLFPAETALATPNSQRCCWPAFATDPTTLPPGCSGGACCRWTGTCVPNGGLCTGDRWQVAKEGFCSPTRDPGCVPPPTSGLTTAVTLKKGDWACRGNTAATCGCKWAEKVPAQTTNVTVGECLGGGC